MSERERKRIRERERGEGEKETERERKRGREGEMPDEINLICPIYRKKFEFPSTKLENIL